MQRRALLSLLLSLPFGFVSTKVMAQVDGPQASFEDNLIAQLEGNWLLTRKIRGTEVQNQVSAKWVLNHQFLQVHMKDVKEPPAYEAIVLIKEALDDFGVPEDIAEGFLDQIEGLILKALDCAEEDSFEEDSEEEEKRPRP